MSGKNQQGFTIIETSLFLAISGLLFIGLFSGITLSIQRQRYSDSVNSTQSFLQKQFNETLNVMNNREDDYCASNAAIGASDCIVMGRAIYFQPNLPNSDIIKTYTIIGNNELASPEGGIADYHPRAVEDSNSTDFSIPWGAKIVAAKRNNSNNINTIALIRSPDSGATYVYALNLPSGATSGMLSDNDQLINGTQNLLTSSNTAKLCLESEDLSSAQALIEFNGAGTQDGVVTKFDQESNCDLPS